MSDHNGTNSADVDHFAPPAPPQDPSGSSTPAKSRVGLWVGIGVGAFLLLAIAAAAIGVAVWAVSSDRVDAASDGEGQDVLDILDQERESLADANWDLGGELVLPSHPAPGGDWLEVTTESGRSNAKVNPSWESYSDQVGALPDGTALGLVYELGGAWYTEPVIEYGDNLLILATYAKIPTNLGEFHSGYVGGLVSTMESQGERRSSEYSTALGYDALVTHEPVEFLGSTADVVVVTVETDNALVSLQLFYASGDAESAIALALTVADTVS